MNDHSLPLTDGRVESTPYMGWNMPDTSWCMLLGLTTQSCYYWESKIKHEPPRHFVKSSPTMRTGKLSSPPAPPPFRCHATALSILLALLPDRRKQSSAANKFSILSTTCMNKPIVFYQQYSDDLRRLDRWPRAVQTLRTCCLFRIFFCESPRSRSHLTS